jgi:SAM-dependent methyltransferase
MIPAAFNPRLISPTWITRRLLLKSISKYAPQCKGRLLDFGCDSKPYRSLFEVQQYIGVDFAGEGHDHSNEQIDVFYDGRHLPFDDGSFDVVFSTEVFEHVFNLQEMLAELHRVLKPGGLMLFTCPFAICEHEQPVDFARHTSFGIRHLMISHGFEVVEQEKLGTAQEALWQMRITYWNLHIVERFRNIPVVRNIVRYGFNVLANMAAVVCHSILPKRQDLYLNNVLLVKKEAS